MTTDSTATVTLPVWTLQNLRVRALATAALRTLDLARQETYWASEVGRAKSASMWCGQQDAVAQRLADLTSRIAEELATAEALAATITASGYQVVRPSNFGVIEQTCATAQLILDLPSNVIGQTHVSYWDGCAANLRDFLAGKY